MKKIIFAFALMTAIALGLCSCESRGLDGDWDPMKWKTSTKAGKDGKIAVTSQGGNYTFICTNYSQPWLSDMEETHNGVTTHHYIDDYSDRCIITTSWITAKFVDNILSVEVTPNETDKDREMTVVVTAGDIFDTFTFKQEAVRQ